MLSSPMRRCRETAEGWRSHAARAGDLRLDRRLGDPGPFVGDVELGWNAYLRLGKHDLVAALVGPEGPLPGFIPPREGVAELMRCLLPAGKSSHGEGVIVAFSHDIIMSVLLAHTARRPLARVEWPDFHEGMVLVGDSTHASIHYRDAVIDWRA
jgi:broad specificity phosphatase PhoE